eukprot:s1014_g8.t1
MFVYQRVNGKTPPTFAFILFKSCKPTKASAWSPSARGIQNVNQPFSTVTQRESLFQQATGRLYQASSKIG